MFKAMGGRYVFRVVKGLAFLRVTGLVFFRVKVRVKVIRTST